MEKGGQDEGPFWRTKEMREGERDIGPRGKGVLPLTRGKGERGGRGTYSPAIG